MKTLAIDRRFILEILFAILITIFSIQLIYAGLEENKVREKIVVPNDGIARIIDSNGIISLSPADRKMEKGEIKFGAAIIDKIAAGMENIDRKYSLSRGGKVLESDEMILKTLENTFIQDDAVANNSIAE